MNKKILQISLAAMLFASPAMLSAKALVTIGKEKITVEEFKAALDSEVRSAKRALKPEEKDVVLRAMINQRLLLAEAKRRKLNKDKRVKAALKTRENELMVQAIIDDEVFSKSQVKPDEVRQFFDKNPQLFDVVRVSQILVAPLSADKKKAAGIEAKRLKRKATKKNFAALAKENSDDTLSKERGGDLGWLRRGMMLKELETAVYGAKKGAFLLVESQYGFHVLLVTDRKTETFQEASQIIGKELSRGRINEVQTKLLTELEKKHTVKINKELAP